MILFLYPLLTSLLCAIKAFARSTPGSQRIKNVLINVTLFSLYQVNLLCIPLLAH